MAFYVIINELVNYLFSLLDLMLLYAFILILVIAEAV